MNLCFEVDLVLRDLRGSRLATSWFLARIDNHKGFAFTKDTKEWISCFVLRPVLRDLRAIASATSWFLARIDNYKGFAFTKDTKE